MRKIHQVILNGTIGINNLVQESQSNKSSFGINDIISKHYLFFIIFIAIISTAIIGILYARKRRKKYVPDEFGLLEKENNEIKSKDNALFENSKGLFDKEEDNEKK